MGQRIRLLLNDKNEQLIGRLVLVDLDDVAEEICQRHGSGEPASLAMCQTSVALGLMGAMIKGEERLSLQVVCDGALGQVMADLTAEGSLRAYVRNPAAVGDGSDSRARLSRCLGIHGAVHVMRSLDEDVLYRGASSLLPAGLERSFERYLKDSDQLPSWLCLDCEVDETGAVKRARGLLFQAVGGADLSLFERAAAQLDRTLVREVLSASSLGEVPALVFATVLGGTSLGPKSLMPMNFKCHCSSERAEGSLAVLGANDLARLLQEQGGTEVSCHFCSAHYAFNSNDLMRIIAEMTVAEDSAQA